MKWLVILAFLGSFGAYGKSAKKVPAKKLSLSLATFGGGCFWCMEPPFDKAKGVVKTISGYSGGAEINPTYKQVSSGKTGHAEVVQVHFDKKQISYGQLLEIFWRNIDPTVKDRQFVDEGAQYRSAIFYHSEEQRNEAEKSKRKLMGKGIFKKPIVTEITKYTNFYAAEEYHQNYYKKNPIRYKIYRFNSGRDQFLKKYWGEKKR